MEIKNGDKVTVKGEGSEVFTVSQLSGSKCWIGDSQERGWYIDIERLEVVETEEKTIESIKSSLSFGYDPEDLERVFKACANPDDWKDAIFVEVPGDLVSITVAAIKFYTATNPRVSLNVDSMRYLIQSEGYRMGPAGDH